MPARRVVQFSDVPVAGAVVTRPTETTTARAAITAAVRAPTRQQWSLIGGAALVLILLVVVASIGGDDDAGAGAEAAEMPAAALPAAAPPPVPSAAEPEPATAAPAPKAKQVTSAKRTDKPPRTAPVGQAVDLEELPVLAAEAPPTPSTRSVATPQRRQTPKAAPKTETNIFNQAKNLAQRRATQRSGTVKSGSGD